MPVAPIIPWEVAESVALRLATLKPRSLKVVGEDYKRVHRVLAEGLEPRPILVPSRSDFRRPVEAMVWIADADSPESAARQLLLRAAEDCQTDVVVVQPVVVGRGISSALLRKIDPGLSAFESDELTSRRGTPRQRKSWEARGQWLVAQVAAWRFAPDAEAARSGFRMRLPTCDAATLVLACRRIQQRYGRAHEVFALAAEELGRRGDRAGVHQVHAELVMGSNAPLGVLSRVRAAAVGTYGKTPLAARQVG